MSVSNAESNIRVKTIGYYQRDADLKVTLDVLPKALNINRRYFENPYANGAPFLKLDIPVKDVGGGEKFNESLLDYIGQKGFPEDVRVDVVTNRQLVRFIASQEYNKEFKILAHRHKDVIFLLKCTAPRDFHTNFGAVFEHWLTKATDDEPIPEDGVSRKAVFTAEIPLDSGEVCNVMYSGEIDAIHQNRHFEMKVCAAALGTPYFHERNSCGYYWQSLLGNVDDLIFGLRTGRFPNDFKTRGRHGKPPYSLYAIDKVSREELYNDMLDYSECSKTPFKPWKIEDGEKNLADFFSLILGKLTKNGDSLVFEKDNNGEDWRISESSEELDKFKLKIEQFV